MTLVVAGAGFGKSTVLAQAYRADELRPPGVQAWVGIEPGLEDADTFVSAVFIALGAARRSADPLTDLVRLLDSTAPVPLCLVLDDVHRLGARSSAAAVLGGLVRRLPAHVHLVLASRTTPSVPLAALHAGNRVLEIGETDLAFTAQECATLATLLGRSPSVAHFGGWPALVRLCLARRDSVAWQFPREEVLAELAEPQLTALFALALVGTAGVDLVSEIVGFPCDLDDLAEHVPLVSRVGRDDFHAHELWAETIAATPPRRLRGCAGTPSAHWPPGVTSHGRAPSPWPGRTGRSSPTWRSDSSSRLSWSTPPTSLVAGCRSCRSRSAGDPGWSC